MEDLPAWLETLFNVNPSLAERALVDVKRWMEIETVLYGSRDAIIMEIDELGHNYQSDVRERWIANKKIIKDEKEN